MKISFFGAAQTVTGSKHLIELNSGETILLDCGMFQGMGKDTIALNNDLGFDPARLDHVVLSHAHVDHSGLLPKLVKDGFKGKIYCTSATYDLCQIMLRDSAYIQEADARFINKRRIAQGLEKIEPAYNSEDVEACLTHFVTIPYDREYKLGDFIKILLTNNGHILGSAGVSLKLSEGNTWKTLFFSGDIGRYNTTLLQDPQPFPQADILVVESTYGDRLHDQIDNAQQRLLQVLLNTCVEKKGKLIIPSFSVGRTQELIYSMNKLNFGGLLPKVKVYVDSPLAINATEITKDHAYCLNKEVRTFASTKTDPFGFEKLEYVRDVKESKKLNSSEEPCVIISAAGMAEAGRVKHHIFNNIENPKNTILLVGYAEPLSLAGKLRRGEKVVKIFGEEKQVLADVMVLDAYSAHGDYQEMIRYLKCQDPTKVEQVFVVHGEPESQKFYKQQLKANGFNHIHIPEKGSSYYV